MTRSNICRSKQYSVYDSEKLQDLDSKDISHYTYMIENAFSETDSPWNFPEHGIPGAEERIEKLKQKDQQDLTLAENEELDKLNNNHLVLKTFREQFNVVLIDAENRLKSSGTAFDSEDNPSRFFVYIQREMDKFYRLKGNLLKAFSAALNKSRLDKYSFFP